MQNQTGVAPQQLQQNISSYAVSPQATPQVGYKDIIYQIEQGIGADVQRLGQLVQKGIVSQTQGQYLLAQLARKAQEINNLKSSEPTSVSPQSYNQTQTPIDMFNQENPNFFVGDGRSDVLNYIKGLNLDKDEIVQISKMIEKLENSAVNKYLKKSEYEKSLNDENTAAKSKLTSYAQNSSSDGNLDRIFTREDIGNMSGDEFTEKEKSIMEQVKQGLIK